MPNPYANMVPPQGPFANQQPGSYMGLKPGGQSDRMAGYYGMHPDLLNYPHPAPNVPPFWQNPAQQGNQQTGNPYAGGQPPMMLPGPQGPDGGPMPLPGQPGVMPPPPMNPYARFGENVAPGMNPAMPLNRYSMMGYR